MFLVGLKKNEIKLLKTISQMLMHNVNSVNKIDITAYSIAKQSGLSRNTVKTKLKLIKEL